MPFYVSKAVSGGTLCQAARGVPVPQCVKFVWKKVCSTPPPMDSEDNAYIFSATADAVIPFSDLKSSERVLAIVEGLMINTDFPSSFNSERRELQKFSNAHLEGAYGSSDL